MIYPVIAGTEMATNFLSRLGHGGTSHCVLYMSSDSEVVSRDIGRSMKKFGWASALQVCALDFFDRWLLVSLESTLFYSNENAWK